MQTTMRKSILFLTFLCLQAGALRAQVTLTERAAARTDFELVTADGTAAVCYDAADAAVVGTATGLFAADVARVTGREIPVVDGSELPAKTRCAVIVGTVGQSRWIDELAAAKKIDVTPIEGGWERYTLRTARATDCAKRWSSRAATAAARPTGCSRCRAPSA